MKKTQITLVILLFLCSNIFSQDSNFEFGMYPGANLTFHTGNDYPELFNPNPGLSVGLLGQYNFSNKFSLRSGISLHRKIINGEQLYPIRFPNAGGFQLAVPPHKWELEESYLTIPLLAQYHFGKYKSFYFNAGVYLDYLLINESSFDKLDGTFIGTGNLTEIRRTGLDFGLQAGIGTKFKIRDKLKMFVEIGSLSAFKKAPSYRKNTYKLGMDSANFKIGFMFKL